MRIPLVSANSDVGLLFLRVSVGLMMLFGHGLGKLLSFSEKSATFADPLGLGNPAASLAMAIFAEVICSIALIVGYRTRIVAVPLLITMLVAATIVHVEDPWQKKEMALMYAIPFLTLILAGGGKYALSAIQFRE